MKEFISDYSDLAKDYDDIRYTKLADRFIDLLRKNCFQKLLKPHKKMAVLDVGTGTGSGVIFFANEVDKIVGADATKEMLDIARQKTQNLKNVDFIQCNALEIPFEDETFDAVISLNFVHLFVPQGIEQQKKFVQEMQRVVKKTGHIIIEFDNKMHYKELGNTYSELFKMSDMKICDILGVSLPLTKKMFSCSKTLAKLYSFLPHYRPFKYLAHRWVVDFEKS